MIVEGKNAVSELVSSGATINKMYVQNDLSDIVSNQIIKKAKARGIRIDFVDKQILDKKSTQKRHQGFICDTVEFMYNQVEEIFEVAKQKEEAPFIIILDGIEDPHNFGAIIRTAECAGVHGIIIPSHRACLVNDTVLKTSVGAAFNIKICQVSNINTTIDALKKQNVWVYGLELGGKDIYSTKLTGAIALVIGSEGFGISKLTKEKCDELITLPQRGKVNSLNASVACGIATYEILKQRG